MDLRAAIGEWQTLLGSSRVLLGDAVLQAFGHDASGIERRIPAALQIVDSSTIPAVVRIAHRHKIPVHPISTGRNWGYGSAMPAHHDCVILDLSGLRKILHFDADLGVVTVEPGVTQGLLAEFLDSGSHPYLVPVTGAGPTCSLMGNALERGYGITPHADHFGAVTDLEAVLADGSPFRTALHELGGADLAGLFKWGVGPFMTGLFTQSGFGVVTRMTIALARRPECIKACLFSLRDDALLEPAVERIRTILSSLQGPVGAINLMNRHRVLAMSAPFPNDRLDGDGLIPESVVEAMGRARQIFPWTGFATLYGSRRIVAAAQKEIRAALVGVASRLLFVTPQKARTLAGLARWIPGATGRNLTSTVQTLAKSLELVAGRPNETALPLAYWRNPRAPQGTWRDPSRDGCGLIWYAPLVPMRPAGVRAYVSMVKQVVRRHHIEPLITLTSINDKVFDSTVPLIFDRDRPEALGDARACYRDLFESGKMLGSVPYRLASDSFSLVAGAQNSSQALHQRLRASVDPHGIISPGRYLGPEAG